MHCQQLSPDELYRALLARDECYDGRIFVGVTSTGVFCRLSCPARKPRFENCRFHDTAAACIDAGFRPCKRCRPLTSMITDDPMVSTLLRALDKRPDHRWTERDVAALGLDTSTVRRSFRRNFGITFLEVARHRRIRSGIQALGVEGKVINAQLEAGFESASVFRVAVARLLGLSPSAFCRDAALRAGWVSTPLGTMIAVSDTTALHLLEFVDRKSLARKMQALHASTHGGITIGRSETMKRVEAELARFFSGAGATFTVKLAQQGSSFSRAVWAALRDIPPGETRSYTDIAKAVGRPSAVRAVARANSANQIALIVPCHRVIGTDGTLTNYGGGLWRKQRMIELEREYLAKSGQGRLVPPRGVGLESTAGMSLAQREPDRVVGTERENLTQTA